jgi:hypothetical protein
MLDWKVLKRLLSECSYKDSVVYMCLMSYNGSGYCYPSRKLIAGMLHLKKEESVSSSLRSLEEKGYIRRIYNNGRSTSYKFLNFEGIEMKPADIKSRKSKKVGIPLCKAHRKTRIF